MSAVHPVWSIVEPEAVLRRLFREWRSQAIGPRTSSATRTMGCSAILAPSKVPPPTAAPGIRGVVRPCLRSRSPLPWFLLHPGSSTTSVILASNGGDVWSLQ